MQWCPNHGLWIRLETAGSGRKGGGPEAAPEISACPRSVCGAALGGSPFGGHDVFEAVLGIGPCPLGTVPRPAQAGNDLCPVAGDRGVNKGIATARYVAVVDVVIVGEGAGQVRRPRPRLEADGCKDIVDIPCNQIHGMARVRLEAVICPGEG